MPSIEREELLILTKTYPSPSSKHRETTCVAAVNSAGELRRIFPVPFRLLSGDKQFKKWEWISASLSRPHHDHRPESRRIDTDSIHRTGKSIQVRQGNWTARLKWVMPHVVFDFPALEKRRQEAGQTLGFLRPAKLVELEITPVKNTEWSAEDRQKLIQEGLFDTDDVKQRAQLRKLPFDFHYRYECGNSAERHKIVDWEIGALYWNCFRDHGPRGWERKFRDRLEVEFAAKDLFFLMGTIHRFPDQWLIVGLVYPPKPQATNSVQQLGLALDQ